MMATIENKLGKLVERYERGLLTDAEVGNDVLLTLADVDESQHVTELFDSLPQRLQATVRNRLNELQESGFNWRPFMIGEGLSGSPGMDAGCRRPWMGGGNSEGRRVAQQAGPGADGS